MRLPDTLSEPTLLLDLDRVRANIAAMVARARSAGVRFRPHFKTHQSQAIGRLFRDQGVSAITVSSLAMAEYFAADGWDDITLAFPFHRGMAPRVAALAERLRLGILIADPEALDGVRPGSLGRLDAWIKIDLGNHRAGVASDHHAGIDACLAALTQEPGLRLRGFLGHAGHSYAARGADAVLAVHQQALAQVAAVLQRYQKQDSALEFSVGDTPTCALAEQFGLASEIRPGNFVFFDLSQWQIGACSAEQIALALACPVATRVPDRGELILHGGAVYLSRDSLVWDGEVVYGLLGGDAGGFAAPATDLRLVGLSQEHARLRGPAERLAQYRPGDTVLIYPVHSCLTADAMGGYRSLCGLRISMMPRGD